MMVKRLNLGCGSVQPEGWDNVDQYNFGQRFVLMDGGVVRGIDAWDQRADTHGGLYDYDVIVCNHMLSDIGHHDLPSALKNIYLMLAHGGVLRILVPDVIGAAAAWKRGDEAWFPQDERTGDIDAKFCTFVTWFGESRSVFTWGYLSTLLLAAGFEDVSVPLNVGQSRFGWLGKGITNLDGDRTTSLIVEAVK